MSTHTSQFRDESTQAFVNLPAPTAWPFTLALGTSLMFAGLLTNVAVSVLGIILSVFGAIGWFREVLPHERHERVPVRPHEPVVTPPREVMRLAVAQQVQRAWLPLKVYPISAGIKGGLAGGVAMALLAVLYGLIFFKSIWYPVNLLAGMFYAPSATPSIEELLDFRIGWLLFALALHITICLLVGVLYGAMLPMLSGHPIVLGGVIAPLLWTGLLYFLLDLLNPLMDKR